MNLPKHQMSIAWVAVVAMAAFAVALSVHPAVAATTDETVGKVETVAGDQLTITTSDTSSKKTFTVPSSATVMLDGKTVKLDRLTKGDGVTVKTETKDGATTVTSVDAKSAEQKNLLRLNLVH